MAGTASGQVRWIRGNWISTACSEAWARVVDLEGLAGGQLLNGTLVNRNRAQGGGEGLDAR